MRSSRTWSGSLGGLLTQSAVDRGDTRETVTTRGDRTSQPYQGRRSDANITSAGFPSEKGTAGK